MQRSVKKSFAGCIIDRSMRRAGDAKGDADLAIPDEPAKENIPLFTFNKHFSSYYLFLPDYVIIRRISQYVRRHI